MSSASDRFGDYGLVGLTIPRPRRQPEGRRAASELLRAGARREHRMIAHSGEQAVRVGLAYGRALVTDRKDRPVRDFDALPMHTRTSAARIVPPRRPPPSRVDAAARRRRHLPWKITRG